MTVALIPTAAHLKAVRATFADADSLARGAHNRQAVLDRLAQAKLSLDEIESRIKELER